MTRPNIIEYKRVYNEDGSRGPGKIVDIGCLAHRHSPIRDSRRNSKSVSLTTFHLPLASSPVQSRFFHIAYTATTRNTIKML